MPSKAQLYTIRYYTFCYLNIFIILEYALGHRFRFLLTLNLILHFYSKRLTILLFIRCLNSLQIDMSNFWVVHLSFCPSMGNKELPPLLI